MANKGFIIKSVHAIEKEVIYSFLLRLIIIKK